MTIAGQFDESLIADIKVRDPKLGQVLEGIAGALNTVATNAGVSPVGDIAAPKAPDAVAVKVAGEMMHVSISHSGPLQRGVRYFTEIATEPSFAQPIVIDHGTSRTPHPFPLPTYIDAGGTKINYYVRSYAQNPGGPPSPPTVVGGKGNPTKFNMGGTTQLTPLASTGSGTAPNTGQSAGQGLGTFQRRKS